MTKDVKVLEQPFPTFTTKRLFFRQLRLEDAHDVFQLFSDPTAMKFDGGQTMSNQNEAVQFIRYYSTIDPQALAFRWAMTSRETGEFFGTAGFYKINHLNKRAEIGGEILKKHWRKGIASEAINGLIHFGFNALGLNRISAMVSPQNQAALALIHNSPFKKEGCLREWERWGGEWTDLNVYGVLKDEWNPTSTL